MSDALLLRIATATEALLALQQGGAKPAAAPAAAKPAAAAPAVKAAADRAAAASAAKPAAAPAAPKAAAAKPAAAPAAATKAPGGKYNSEQVRDAIRKVAVNVSLGKKSALDILDQDGGGVTNVTNLKPEFFDSVYEACQAMLSGEGEDGPPVEDDLM